MTEHIVSLLILERSRLQAAIDALGGEESNIPEWVLGKSAVSTPAQKSHSERMKENWAKRKAAQAQPTAVATAPVGPKKRTMSAEGRQRIIDATKERWARIKAAKVETVTPKKKTKNSIISEAVAPAAEMEFKSKMSIAMAKSWAKRKKAAKKRKV